MKIYHYTTIESLALILKNKTIRFSRLDQVDDVEEAHKEPLGFMLGLYTYISCWTKSSEENISLWNLYAPDKKGVRITLEDNMFIKNDSNNESYNQLSLFKNISAIISPNQNLRFDNQHLLVIVDDYKDMLKDITYIDKYQYNNSVIPYALEKKIIPITEEIILSELKNLGLYKNKRWSFQEESRFRLFFLPIQKHYNNICINTEAISKKQISDKTNIDIQINATSIKNIEITLSPFAGESEKIIVNSLCNSYCRHATIHDSALRGKIRK